MNYLITGASRGIGYDTALHLAQNPAHQVLAISRNADALAALAQKAEELTGRQAIHTMVFDLTKDKFDTLKAWVQSFGSLNGIVNNAGVLINKSFDELTLADWHQSFAINLFAAVELIQTLSPVLENAHIINIGSMGGFQGSAKFPGLAAYSASKAALANLSECLAEEYKDRDVAVNCLALGAVQTEMLANAFPGYQAPVSSENMGEWVAWFLENGQRFFNGKVLPVSITTP